MIRQPRLDWLLSRTLEVAILGLVVMVANQAAKASDPFLCKEEGRRLTDAELVAESLAFLRNEQFDTPFLPRPPPEGYKVAETAAVLEDPRFRFMVDRRAGGHGEPVGPRRSWLGRQIFGERLSVTLIYPADTPGFPMLQVRHVSNPCGQVRRDLGYRLNEFTVTAPLPSETE